MKKEPRIVLNKYGVKEVKGDIGVEVEVEGWGFGNLPVIPNWRTHGDGSLRGKDGIEFILDKPVKINKVRDSVGQLVAGVRSTVGLDWEPSQRCGIHIHVNCQALTEQQVFNYACCYYIFEDLLIDYCGPHRSGNLFCLSISDAEELFQRLLSCCKEGTLYGMQGDTYRYSSLNYGALQKYGSIEFRSMRTPDLDDLVNVVSDWANILWNIQQGSLRIDNAKSIVEILSKQGVNNFMKMMLGEYAALFARNPRIHFMLMRGVRKIQDLAYSGWGEDAVGAKVEGKEVFIEPDDDMPRPGRLRGRPIGGLVEAAEVLNWNPVPAPPRPRPALQPGEIAADDFIAEMRRMQQRGLQNRDGD